MRFVSMNSCRRYVIRKFSHPLPALRKRNLKLRRDPVAIPILTIQKLLATEYLIRCAQLRCSNDVTHNRGT